MGDNCPTANDLGGNYRGIFFGWVGGWQLFRGQLYCGQVSWRQLSGGQLSGGIVLFPKLIFMNSNFKVLQIMLLRQLNCCGSIIRKNCPVPKIDIYDQ